MQKAGKLRVEMATCVPEYKYGEASPQLVAVHDGPRIARHVVQRTALHKCVDARFAEQDERSPIVIAARITGDFLALSEQLADGQRLAGGHTGRCEHRCKENA
jgi:hypothetical protein